MKRKGIISIICAVTCLLGISAAAIAGTYTRNSPPGESDTGRLTGGLTVSWSTMPNPQGITAELSGRSSSSQKCQDILVEIQMYDGMGYLEGSDVGELWDFPVAPCTISAWVPPVGCYAYANGYGYHYVQYDGGSDIESFHTSVTTRSGSSLQSADPADVSILADMNDVVSVSSRFLAEYARSDASLDAWASMTQYESDDKLKSLLGAKSGTQLGLLFHRDLNRYLRIGDTMPGLLLGPDGSDALALFFHENGTVTRVRLSMEEDKSWRVDSVDENPTPR